MFQSKPLFLLPLLAISHRPAPVPFEVNTHQWLTAVAVGGSVGLSRFLDETQSRDVLYDYDHAEETAAVNPQVTVQSQGRSAAHLIAKGAVLEDSSPRWLYHFYDPTDDSGLFVSTSTSRRWALGDGLVNGYFNDYSWPQAMEYFRRGFSAALPDSRAYYQSKMFRSLGQVVHLIQDSCQPSHTRDDSHSNHWLVGIFDGYSELETWGKRNLHAGNAAPEVAAAVYGAPTRAPAHPADLFQAAADYSNGNFVSDDTIFTYAEPSLERANRVVPSNSTSWPGLFQCRMIDIGGQEIRLCYEYESWLGETIRTLASHGNVVVRDHARLLLPRAVSLSRSAIDYFFRGSFALRPNDPNDPTALLLENRSDARAGDVTFSNGSITFYYEAQDGTFNSIPVQLAVPSLAAGATMQGPAFDFGAHLSSIRAGATAPNVLPREDNRIIALYDGLIGDEPGVACLYWRPESFLIEDVTTEHMIFNGAAGDVAVDWTGVPRFTVRAQVSSVTCPPGWVCYSADIPFSLFADPLVFQYFCWGSSSMVGTWYSRWSVRLVDSDGRRTPAFEYDMTCVSGGGPSLRLLFGDTPTMGFLVK